MSGTQMKGAVLVQDGMHMWQYERSLARFAVCWRAVDASHSLQHADIEVEGYHVK